MSYEKHADYNQVWMFPPTLEDLVEEDHPARFIREFVDALNLRELGFRTRESEAGRPNYSAEMLTKVWLYGYFHKIRSSRGLERACRENFGLAWLTGMQQPDHNTLWRFWRTNREGLQRIFRQGIRVAARAELVGMVLHAVDGTRIASAGLTKNALHREDLEELLRREELLERSIAKMTQEVEEAEQREAGEYRLPKDLGGQRLKERVEAELAELNQEEVDHLLPSDPEARMMKANGRTMFGYNAQAAVDSDSGLIVAADVVNDEDDHYLLNAALDQVEENLGRVADETVADGGYATASELAKAEEKGREVIVNMGPEPQGEYHHSRFVYDAETDCCICPRGETLKFRSIDKGRSGEEVRIYQCQSYKQCPVRWQCSRAQDGRRIRISAHDAVWRRHLARQKSERVQAILKKRNAIIERFFGWIKEACGFRRWTVRGLENVRTQWLMLCTSCNLRTMYRAWAAGELVFAKGQ